MGKSKNNWQKPDKYSQKTFKSLLNDQIDNSIKKQLVTYENDLYKIKSEIKSIQDSYDELMRSVNSHSKVNLKECTIFGCKVSLSCVSEDIDEYCPSTRGRQWHRWSSLGRFPNIGLLYCCTLCGSYHIPDGEHITSNSFYSTERRVLWPYKTNIVALKAVRSQKSHLIFNKLPPLVPISVGYF
jgi:hypothetical protein